MYTEEQYEKALRLYDECGSVTKTMVQLGYPARRQTLYNWINRRKKLPAGHSTFRGVNTPEHPRHPPLELKLNVLHRCFELGEDVQLVSDEIGYSKSSIYTWRKKYIQKGRASLMTPSNDRERGALKEGAQCPSEDISQFKSQIENMQLEIDILKATLDVLKKDPGADQTALKNCEKAVIVDALKHKYSLPQLFQTLHYARSSYYHFKKREASKDKYTVHKEMIRTIFNENNQCYGYRRIYLALKEKGMHISEKVVRRLMKEEQIQVHTKKQASYSSYRGEITPSVPNIISRDFCAKQPNEKWLTDITEFSIPAGKLYLSPIIDCFDGMPVCWRFGTTPNADLVNGMLDDAITNLRPGEQPIVHTDRGCHYRWPGWIERMNHANLQRSMSKKGCSPDNSACEGFFGRMKNEMFYGRSWVDITMEEFTEIIQSYMVWYREKRIKQSLGGMSPLKYRQNLGLCY